MLNKRWIEPSLEVAGAGPESFPPVERAILGARGVRTDQQAEQFLGKRYEGPDDPFLMADMQVAVERLISARHAGEKTVVYGDYDADGVSATALLYEVLRSQGLDASWYVPDRFDEGYGLNPAAMSRLYSQGASLLVSVDCGIRSEEAVGAANAIGLDVIVTDHHLPGQRLPPALAVINPNRQDDGYPFKGLSGVGVAYKLAQGLMQAEAQDEDESILDLVALGTVTDLAPLRDENRELVAAGLAQLNAARRPGLRALAEHAGLSAGSISAKSIGFGLGPRLNAAGRLAGAGEAVELLLAKPGAEAWERAAALDRLNRERQELTNETVERAREIVTRSPLAENLVIAIDPTFHEGIVGLVASRLTDEFYRPSLVGREENEIIRGSARSIPEFNITRALDECSDLLDRFGGHEAAAGFALQSSNLESFLQRLDGIAADRFAELDLRPSLRIDAIVNFNELTDKLMGFIDRLEPCGEGNPYPVFATRRATVLSKRTVGAAKTHLKLTLRQAERVFDAIGFGMGAWLDELPRTVDLVYRLERNEFRGVVALQLLVLDLRPS